MEINTCLKATLISFDSSMSLNMPSSFDVKPPPHSCFNFDNMLFSASTLADLPTNSLLAKSLRENSFVLFHFVRKKISYLFIECFKHIFPMDKLEKNHDFIQQSLHLFFGRLFVVGAKFRVDELGCIKIVLFFKEEQVDNENYQ